MLFRSNYQFGASKYLNGGLLSMPLNFNAPTGNAVQQYTTPVYQPTPWSGPSEMYQLGNLLYQGNNPIFRWVGQDMMRAQPMGTYTITKG